LSGTQLLVPMCCKFFQRIAGWRLNFYDARAHARQTQSRYGRRCIQPNIYDFYALQQNFFSLLRKIEDGNLNSKPTAGYHYPGLLLIAISTAISIRKVLIKKYNKYLQTLCNPHVVCGRGLSEFSTENRLL
jgi:hypothetical protein